MDGPPATSPSPTRTALPPPGAAVALTLADGSSVRGFVHAVDKASGLVCVEEIPGGAVVLVPTVSITNSAPLDNVPPRRWPNQPAIDVTRVRAEEDRIFRRRHSEYAQVGIDVSPAAQAIFDTLAKTLPCKWQRDIIVILDTVHLAPPYDVRSLSGDADAGVVSRVRMILEHEGAAIKIASSAEPASVTPAAPAANGVTP